MLDTIGGENINRSLPLIKKGVIIIKIPTGLTNDVSERSTEFGVSGKIFTFKSNGEDMAVIAKLLKNSNLKSHISKVFAFEEK
ncbi:zinc-binding dehydrogenase [Chryseobacterium caseinilyticum]|uniref:Zinc-binding dehydrogenase n=1 Tax=Chryseobacterium caseinilyticum TaxID=2771428 RepID=A0ABR8Z688_9FLAO|nr:zinc-binding dehydrogenase [Chryseobacterium caseinilyticum]MBD8080809.1 zinc-binding dehydrogenase [Chryseobacterium caseinilyticum]